MDERAIPKPTAEALMAARELGRQEAAAFDAGLQNRELREREIRLGEATWQPDGSGEAEHDPDAALRVAQLEERIKELNDYLRAVEDSRPWRLIQSARRFFGRAW